MFIVQSLSSGSATHELHPMKVMPGYASFVTRPMHDNCEWIQNRYIAILGDTGPITCERANRNSDKDYFYIAWVDVPLLPQSCLLGADNVTFDKGFIQDLIKDSSFKAISLWNRSTPITLYCREGQFTCSSEDSMWTAISAQRAGVLSALDAWYALLLVKSDSMLSSRSNRSLSTGQKWYTTI